jgi:hypothetical protein
MRSPRLLRGAGLVAHEIREPDETLPRPSGARGWTSYADAAT